MAVQTITKWRPDCRRRSTRRVVVNRWTAKNRANRAQMDAILQLSQIVHEHIPPSFVSSGTYLWILISCIEIIGTVPERKIVKSEWFSAFKRIEQNNGHVAAADQWRPVGCYESWRSFSRLHHRDQSIPSYPWYIQAQLRLLIALWSPSSIKMVIMFSVNGDYAFAMVDNGR